MMPPPHIKSLNYQHQAKVHHSNKYIICVVIISLICQMMSWLHGEYSVKNCKELQELGMGPHTRLLEVCGCNPITTKTTQRIV